MAKGYKITRVSIPKDKFLVVSFDYWNSTPDQQTKIDYPYIGDWAIVHERFVTNGKKIVVMYDWDWFKKITPFVYETANEINWKRWISFVDKDLDNAIMNIKVEIEV